MYCKRCGYKVGQQDTRCRHCGEGLEELEVCGGFWGLVGKQPAAPVVPVVPVQEPVAAEPTETETAPGKAKRQREQQPVSRQFPILFRVAIGVCVVCLLALILLFVNIWSNAETLKKLQGEIAEHKTTIGLLQAELEDAQEELEAARQQAQIVAQQKPEVSAPSALEDPETEEDAPVAVSEETGAPAASDETEAQEESDETAAPEDNQDDGATTEEQPEP